MTETVESSKKSYSKKIVVFIDLMGFKAFYNDPDRLFNALKDCRKFLKDDDPAVDFIQFSDCMVIATDATKYDDAIIFLIRFSIRISILMGIFGRALRGAITYGDYLYEDGFLISPAMAEAYLLESKKAVHPRILLDNSLLEVLESLVLLEDKVKHELLRSNISLLMRTDEEDQLRYLDYLRSAGVSYIEADKKYGYSEEKAVSILGLHKQFIKKSLDENTKQDVIEKYLWLMKYHNQIVEAQPMSPENKKKCSM